MHGGVCANPMQARKGSDGAEDVSSMCKRLVERVSQFALAFYIPWHDIYVWLRCDLLLCLCMRRVYTHIPITA